MPTLFTNLWLTWMLTAWLPALVAFAVGWKELAKGLLILWAVVWWACMIGEMVYDLWK